MVLPRNDDVHIAGLGCASPDYCLDQETALQALQQHYEDSLTPRSEELLDTFFRHPSVRRRRLAIESPEQIFEEDPDARVERFTNRATGLAAQASRQAMRRADLDGVDPGALVVNTCTGYVCPGISNYLIEELDLDRDIKAYDLVGSGCGGAVPNLEMGMPRAGSDAAEAVLCVSVEICTATFQMSNDPSLLVSNALFADGAGAAVLRRGTPGMEVLSSRTLHEPRYREDIRYVYRDGELHNQLSATLPAKSGRVVERLVRELLEEEGLDKGEIAHWAMHPGGEKVMDCIQRRLELSDEQMRPSREVLRHHGNLSSATVWFVLRHILDDGVEPGELCLMVAFGAGLTAHAVLLRT